MFTKIKEVAHSIKLDIKDFKDYCNSWVELSKILGEFYKEEVTIEAAKRLGPSM